MGTSERHFTRRERKRTEAKGRAVARIARGDEAQIARLIAAGHGHCKEVARLKNKGKNKGKKGKNK